MNQGEAGRTDRERLVRVAAELPVFDILYSLEEPQGERRFREKLERPGLSDVLSFLEANGLVELYEEAGRFGVSRRRVRLTERGRQIRKEAREMYRARVNEARTFTILNCLERAGNLDSVSLRHVTGFSDEALAVRLSELEEAGLVELREEPTLRRIFRWPESYRRVYLTEAGRTAREEWGPPPESSERALATIRG